ncbi:hypothetical protein NL676_024561 [Syzygium grande]|nr:hypothetical protein NL676_024561 [Syzygium grande]
MFQTQFAHCSDLVLKKEERVQHHAPRINRKNCRDRLLVASCTWLGPRAEKKGKPDAAAAGSLDRSGVGAPSPRSDDGGTHHSCGGPVGAGGRNDFHGGKGGTPQIMGMGLQ